MRSAGELYFIVGYKGEFIRRCRVLIDFHPKAYRDAVYRALQIGGTAQYFFIFGKNPISKNLEIGPTIFDI